MGYWITRFGVSGTLPTKGVDQQIGPGPVRSSLVRLPGGAVYDTRGADAASEAGQVISLSGIVSAASAAALKTAYDTIRAFKGDRDKLYRTPDGGSANSQWMYARCIDAPTRRVAENKLWVPVTLSFELQESYWHGAANSDTITLDASPKEGEVNNAGTALVRDIVITITANDTAITVVRIANLETGHISHIGYTGTIAIDKALVIDCGAKTVTNDGSDAFSGFSIYTAYHQVSEWLRLKSGDNTIWVMRTGGANTATANFVFDDAWE